MMPWTARVNSVAVLRPAGLGDFIMSAPAFVALRSRFPQARITLLTMHSQNADQAAKVRAYAGAERIAPWIDLLRPHAIDDVRVLPPVGNFRALGDARRAVSSIKPDLIVQMFDPGTPYLRRAAKLGFMFALFGPVRQIGWRQRGQIHPGRPPAEDPGFGHHVLALMQFLREIREDGQLTDEDVVFDVRAGTEASAWAGEQIAQHHLHGRMLIALAPGAIHDHKQWPLQKFAALIAALAEQRRDASFLIMGTGKDTPLAEALADAAPGRVVNFCGVSTIAQSAALFSHCALVVGNDGGAMHLADAVGASVVSVVPGLEFPISVEPWSNQDRAVRLPISCAPCYSFTFCPEGHRRCMLDLPVEAVLAQCARVLVEARPSQTSDQRLRSSDDQTPHRRVP